MVFVTAYYFGWQGWRALLVLCQWRDIRGDVATPRHRGTVMKDRSQREGDVRCASGV